MEKWIAKVVGEMHVNKISITALAEKMGVSRGYASALLNGKRSPQGAKERITKAIQDLIEGKGK